MSCTKACHVKCQQPQKKNRVRRAGVEAYMINDPSSIRFFYIGGLYDIISKELKMS